MDDQAWSEFLENHAGLISQAVGFFERDSDHAVPRRRTLRPKVPEEHPFSARLTHSHKYGTVEA
jgi:hypothetical protein